MTSRAWSSVPSQFLHEGGKTKHHGFPIVGENVGPHLLGTTCDSGGIAESSPAQRGRAGFPAQHRTHQRRRREVGKMADPGDEFVMAGGGEAGHNSPETAPETCELLLSWIAGLFRSENDGGTLEEVGLGMTQPFLLRSGHGMTAEKASASGQDKRPDFANDGTLDAAHIGHDNGLSVNGIKTLDAGNHCTHVTGGHGEDDKFGSRHRLIEVARGLVHETGVGTQFFHRLGTASPGGK